MRRCGRLGRWGRRTPAEGERAGVGAGSGSGSGSGVGAGASAPAGATTLPDGTSSSSVVLNVAEGSGSFGRVRTMRYRTALGSARETLACLRVAEAFGYVETIPEAMTWRINRVIGTLVRVAA